MLSCGLAEENNTNLDKIPDLVEEIKTSSDTFIKGKRLSKFKYEWQKGYGAFTHSHSQIDLVVKYILSQEEHHKKGYSGKNILKFWRRTTFNLKMKMSLNSLMTSRVGVKYCGALHLWCCITYALLQISGGSAAFKYPDIFCKYLTVPMKKGFLLSN